MLLLEVSCLKINSLTFLIFILVPANKALIYLTPPTQSFYEAGDNVTLTCSVSKSPYVDIDTTLKIMWNNFHTASIYVKKTTFNKEHSITFISVKLSDAGEYNCTYFFTSANKNQFVIPSEEKSAISNITLKSKCFNNNLTCLILLVVPNSVKPVFSTLESHHNVSSNITLSCFVSYPYFDLIDVDAKMILLWSNYSKHVLKFSVIPLTRYSTLNYTISNVKLSDAGRYNCSYFISTTIDNPYILTSDTITNFSNVSIKSK